MDLAIQKPARNDGRSGVVVSAFGVGNVGDDLVSIANKKILHRIGLSQVEMTGPQATAEHLRRADLISVGGGGLFYDADYQNVTNYLYPIQAARELGKPSLVLGVGTQGIKHPYGRQAYKNHLRHAGLITVREPGDRDLLCEIDPALDVHVTQDLAFLLADELKPFAQGIDKQKLALLSPSILLDRTFRMSGTDTRSFCRDLIKSLPDHRVILAIHSDNDEAFFRELSVEHQCLALHLGRMGPAGTASLYAAADLVVTSRFHGLIYGCLSGSKIVCVAGKPRSKSTRMVKSFVPSLDNSVLSSAQYTIERLQEKLANARAPDPAEVEACIAAAKRNYDLVDRWAAEHWNA